MEELLKTQSAETLATNRSIAAMTDAMFDREPPMVQTAEMKSLCGHLWEVTAHIYKCIGMLNDRDNRTLNENLHTSIEYLRRCRNELDMLVAAAI